MSQPATFVSRKGRHGRAWTTWYLFQGPIPKSEKRLYEEPPRFAASHCALHMRTRSSFSSVKDLIRGRTSAIGKMMAAFPLVPSSG
eukprot:scaffold1518_cov417-Prasinococcus_capsulatus_cf.AAC.25